MVWRRRFQQRINGSEDPSVIAMNVALFPASLTDRAAIDLYADPYVSSDCAMGHQVHWVSAGSGTSVPGAG